jgi:hypothetical protein
MATSAADKLAVRLSHISGPKDIAAFGGVAGVANAIAGVLGSGADAGVPSGAALLSRGLSPAAAAASSRLFGANSLPTKPVKPFWEHFKEAFEDRTLQVRFAPARALCERQMRARSPADALPPHRRGPMPRDADSRPVGRRVVLFCRVPEGDGRNPAGARHAVTNYTCLHARSPAGSRHASRSSPRRR